MKKTIFILLCCAVHTLMQAKVKEIGKQEFKQEILTSKKPVVVEFYSPDCPFCNKMEPVYNSIALDLGKEYTFLKVNTKIHPRLANEQKVTSLPTFVFYVKEGNNIKEKSRTTGQMKYKKLTTAINKAFAKKEPAQKKAKPAKKKNN